jgi:hypothetical protein
MKNNRCLIIFIIINFIFTLLIFSILTVWSILIFLKIGDIKDDIINEVEKIVEKIVTNVINNAINKLS